MIIIMLDDDDGDYGDYYDYYGGGDQIMKNKDQCLRRL